MTEKILNVNDVKPCGSDYFRRAFVTVLIPHKDGSLSLCGITIYKILYKCYNKYITIRCAVRITGVRKWKKKHDMQYL